MRLCFDNLDLVRIVKKYRQDKGAHFERGRLANFARWYPTWPKYELK